MAKRSAAATPAAEPRPLRTLFTIAHTVPGRLRLKLLPPHNQARLEEGRATLAAAGGVRDVRAHVAAWSLIVEYNPRQVSVDGLLDLPLPAPIAGATPATAPAAPAYPDEVEASTEIGAPIAVVWRILTDPEHISLHAPGTVHVDGAVDADHWLAEVEVLGRTVKLQVDVIERTQEQRLVLQMNGSLRAQLTATLEPAGAATRLHERLEFAVPGRFLGRFVSKVAARPRLRNELTEHVGKIKEAAESGYEGEG
jgi:uncharacterized protein YndB with AHSA1/START domain